MNLFLMFLLLVQSATLRIRVDGFQELQGELKLAVFSGENGFPGESELADVRVSVPVTSDVLTVEVELEKGTYALSLYHDSNGNGVLDRNFLGIPSERTGFSSGAVAVTSAPDYESASFELNTETLFMFVSLH